MEAIERVVKVAVSSALKRLNPLERNDMDDFVPVPKKKSKRYIHVRSFI